MVSFFSLVLLGLAVFSFFNFPSFKMSHPAAPTSLECPRETDIWIATARPRYAGFTTTLLALSLLLDPI